MLRDNLNKYNHATAIHAIPATSDGVHTDRIARITRVQVASPINTNLLAGDETVSNWWLLHFADCEYE